jgi:hypothetical protein
MRRMLILLFVLSLPLLSCNGRQTIVDNDDATGKGNGGDGLMMSRTEISAEFDQLKPALQQVLIGLRSQFQAEQTAPGITDLSGRTDLMNALQLLFNPEADHVNTLDAIDDMQSQFQLIGQPCVDAVGEQKAAGALLLKPKTTICFSLPVIQSETPTGANDALEVLVLSLATHEMVHHFVDYGSRDQDEKIAVAIQAYVASELERAQVVDDGVVVLDTPYSFVSRFRQSSEALLDSAKSRLPSPYASQEESK